MDVVDLTDKKFGKLTAIKYIGKTGFYKCKKYGTQKGYHTWECKCECGNTTNVRSSKLRGGTTKSCGCLKKQVKPKWTLPKGEAAKNLLYSHYKNSADKRKLTFDINKVDFIELTSKNCYYCNAEPSKSVAMRQKGSSSGRSLNGDYLYNGLDRVDNNKGYTKENCVSCCWTCNELKKNRNQKDFIDHLRKIVSNINDKQ